MLYDIIFLKNTFNNISFISKLIFVIIKKKFKLLISKLTYNIEIV